MWTVIKWLIILGVANVISEQASIQSNMDKNLIFVFLVGGAVLLKFVFREPMANENEQEKDVIEKSPEESSEKDADKLIENTPKISYSEDSQKAKNQPKGKNESVLKSYNEILDKSEFSSNPKFNRSEQETAESRKFWFENHEFLQKEENKMIEYKKEFFSYKKKDLSTTELKNKIAAGEKAIKVYDKLQEYCYSNIGGKIYFQNTWEYCHNSKNPCFDFLDDLRREMNRIKDGAIVSKSNKLSTFNQISPNMNEDVLKLLWFYDGDFKNISKDENEPSAISTKLELEIGAPEELGYYPSYEKMTPKQRNYYLDWLTDVRKPIDIGYVFTFYYGLERHLVYGNYKDATDMILLLRQHHNNHSFQSYSQDALIISIALHNDYSIIDRIDIRTLRDDVKASVIAFTKRKFSAENIIEFSKLTGFKNDRYIKNESELFLKTLNSKINGEFIIEDKHLDNCDFLTLAIANYRLDKRFSQMADVLSNKILKEELYNLLLETHEDVKSQLKEIRKQEKNNSKKIIDVSEEEIEKIIDISEEKLKKIIEEEIAYRSQSEDFEMER